MATRVTTKRLTTATSSKSKDVQTTKEMFRDPKQIIADLIAFERDTNIMSSQYAALMTKYSGRWIAICDGEVRADAETLKQLLSNLDKTGFPRRRAVVRRMVSNVRRMIL